MTRYKYLLIGLALTLTLPVSVLARTFNSSLNLKVYENGQGGEEDKYLGTTSSKSAKGVSIPSSDFWYVRPVGKLSDEDLVDLAIEVRKKRIPGIDFSDRWDINDHSLASFEGIPTLFYLDLSRTRVTNAGLEHIATLNGLKFIALPDKITDVGLEHVKDLKHLVAVELGMAKITDRGLDALQGLPKLERLNVSGSQVTDAGVQKLASMDSLLMLDISQTKINDKALPSIAKLRNLIILEISNTRVTPKGTGALSGLSNLDTLSLSRKNLSGEDLRDLARLRNVKKVILNGRVVPPAVLERARNS